MGDFGRRKLEESEARTLDDWDEEAVESNREGWI
jgi:hypothetical protein